MIKIFILSALLGVIAPYSYSQHRSDQSNNSGLNDIALQRNSLTNLLRALAAEAAKLDNPLARSAAQAKVADAAWSLDQAWAQELLRDAYLLTLPTEEEQSKLRDQPVGASPVEPSETELARLNIRHRILNIAAHDRRFAQELSQMGRQKLGRIEEGRLYSTLATRAAVVNDISTATEYVQHSIEAEPTQIGVGWSILEIAARDRKAADDLLLQYIEQLRTVPLAESNAARTYLSLRFAVFPDEFVSKIGQPVPPAGPDVIRAYLSFVLASLTQIEQHRLGSIISMRPSLVSLWLPLQRYAPELIPRFMELEALSRGPNSPPLPTTDQEETNKQTYEAALKKADDTRAAKDVNDAINRALVREDFAEARRLLDWLPDGATKARRAEEINLSESLNLLKKGDIIGAAALAQKLTQSDSVLRAYPLIIRSCAARKDVSCATSLLAAAVQLINNNATKAERPRILVELVKAIRPVDESLALETLEEAVKAANRSDLDTSNGDPGFDSQVFAILMPKDKVRLEQAAQALKDRVQRIISLAAIYRARAEALARRAGREKGRG